MKILYIVNSTTVFGGASKSLLTLLDGLIAKGVRPFVVTPDDAGIYVILRKHGIHVCALKYRPNTYPLLKSLKDYFLFLPRLVARRLLSRSAVNRVVKLCKEEKIQLIHSNVSVIDVGFRAAVKLHIPHVYHFREFCDLDFGLHYYPSKSRFHDSLRKYGSYSICITKTVQEYHGLQGSGSRIIYNGIHCSDATLDNGKRERSFLFAGRIEPAKGLMQLIDAYGIYKSKVNDPYTLLVAGEVCDKVYHEKLLRQIDALNLTGCVVFLGERKDIGNIMQRVSAIVISSRLEAFGRCMPEAMENGCLVIGRNTGGTKEQFDNGSALKGCEIGLRYETTQDLADRLVEVSSASPRKYDKMRLVAFETVKEIYSNDNYINKVFNFYNDILCGR